MFRFYILLSFTFLASSYAQAQVTFQKVYGKGQYMFDWGLDVIETKSGEYIVSGTTESYPAPDDSARRQAYVMKTDCQGTILWNKILKEGFGNESQGNQVIETFDGGLLVAGASETYSQGYSDAFLWKLNSQGVTQWFKSYGTTEWESFQSVIQTKDGGFAAIGYEHINNSSLNIFLLKTDINGTKQWSKSIGAVNNTEIAFSLIERPNGDLIMVGNTYSFGPGANNLLLVKTDANGVITWIRSYGEAGAQSVGNDIINTKDGGYITAGYVQFTLNNWDYYVIKFDASDNIEWAKSYIQNGGTKKEECKSIIQTYDSGFVLGGSNENGFINGPDASLVKIDSAGVPKWAYVYGGPNVDGIRSVIQTPDSSFLATGYSFGLGELSIGGRDIYLIKTDKQGSSGCNEIPFSVNASTVTPQMIPGGTSSNYGTETYPSPTYAGNIFKVDTLCLSLAQSNLPITFSGDTSICEGEGTSLSVSSSGVSFLWSTTSTTQTITVYPTSTTTYSVTVSYSSCYLPSTAVVTVTVNSAPTLTLTASNTVVCESDTVTLTANSNASSFLWSNGETTQSISVAADPSSNNFTATVFNGGCTNSASKIITILPKPIAGIDGDSMLCYGDSIVLIGAGGISFIWNTGETTSSITEYPLINTIYSLTVTNGSCNDTTSSLVIVNDFPTANAGDDTTIVLGQGISLQASGSTSGGYQWYPANGLSCVNCPNPYASPHTTTTYYVIVTDANGCSSIDSVKVSVITDCGAIYVPNAFSPNNDGQNDDLKIYGFECIKSMLLVIYDRWGEKVFETTNINETWDGTYKGKLLDPSVFSYYFEAELLSQNDPVIRKGNINLIK